MSLTLSTETCRHFGVCGGCVCREQNGVTQPPPYADQLAEKDARVQSLLAPFSIEEWRPIMGSPETARYRNKMEYAFGLRNWTERELVLGLREAGKFDRVVDLETCLLMSDESVELISRVRQWAKEHGLRGYDRGRHDGDLRYLVVREGKNTGQRMAILIARNAVREQILATLPELQSDIEPLLSTFWLGFTDARSDVARAEKMHLAWGPGHIEETLNDVRFRISPYSFFQTNTHGTERLYRLLADWARSWEGGGALMDLYCGAGGIALSLASCFDRVIGVDIDAEAIADAKHNAALNNCQNSEFVASETEGFLKILPATKLAVQLSAAVIDPPRPGLQPKALQTILDLNPPRLAYVSCNPEALVRDLQSLVPFYTVQTAQPVDLFPHTRHVETLVTLEHR